MPVTAEATAIRPFRIEVPEEQLADLRRRIAATRWPTRELVGDRSQGVQLATITALARFWETEHDWRACEARLNALPQFTTEIDGVDIHFIHVRSPHEHAMPLVMTHGWPGSVVELLEVVAPLTDPTAHGGRPDDAFDLVLPSVPGYGFSGEPTDIGWDPGRVARAWAELMRRLGYTRYVAQGGDLGAAVTDAMGRQAPDGLLGVHINLLLALLAVGPPPPETEKDRAALAAIATFNTRRAPVPRPPGRTGRTGAPRPSRPARPRPRCRSRSASARSPARSSRRRAAGSRRSTPTSSTTTSPRRAGTSPPGRSPSCSPLRFARRSGRCASEVRTWHASGSSTSPSVTATMARRRSRR